MSKAQRFRKLDSELSWPNQAKAIEVAATTPIAYPLSPTELPRLAELKKWRQAQSLIIAGEHITAFELGMLAKFEMLKWLECGYFETCEATDTGETEGIDW